MRVLPVCRARWLFLLVVSHLRVVGLQLPFVYMWVGAESVAVSEGASFGVVVGGVAW